MRKADVKIGATYAVKVSGRVVPVRIDCRMPPRGHRRRGYWIGVNLRTNREVRILSAARLRRLLALPPEEQRKLEEDQARLVGAIHEHPLTAEDPLLNG